MANRLRAQPSEIVVLHLDPGEDLLLAIREAAEAEGIELGVVLSITGTLDEAVVQRYVPDQEVITVSPVAGPMEISGSGIIGKVVAPSQGDRPFGISGWVDGKSFVHIHITLTSATETVCGHLMPGSLVRSHHSISHFTVVLQKFSGGRLELDVDEAMEDVSKGWGVYYRLCESSDSASAPASS